MHGARAHARSLCLIVHEHGEASPGRSAALSAHNARALASGGHVPRALSVVARVPREMMNRVRPDRHCALTTHQRPDGHDDVMKSLRLALLLHLSARQARRAPASDVNFGSVQPKLRFECGLRTWTARRSEARAFRRAIARFGPTSSHSDLSVCRGREGHETKRVAKKPSEG